MSMMPANCLNKLSALTARRYTGHGPVRSRFGTLEAEPALNIDEVRFRMGVNLDPPGHWVHVQFGFEFEQLLGPEMFP
jgi:hypothetical protein